MEFEDAVEKQRPRCMSSSALAALNESRFETKVEHRLAELEGWFMFLIFKVLGFGVLACS